MVMMIDRFNEQKQDHFDPNNVNVWSQRYFVNDSFFDGTGPVMLCCGGEGPPLTPDVCNDDVHFLIGSHALLVFICLQSYAFLSSSSYSDRLSSRARYTAAG